MLWLLLKEPLLDPPFEPFDPELLLALAAATMVKLSPRTAICITVRFIKHSPCCKGSELGKLVHGE
jgi:hypothetical protein